MDANLEGMPRCVRSLRYGLLLERADDVNVKGSRTTTAPVREEDVCWARLRTRDQTATAPDLVIPEGVSNAATHSGQGNGLL